MLIVAPLYLKYQSPEISDEEEEKTVKQVPYNV